MPPPSARPIVPDLRAWLLFGGFSLIAVLAGCLTARTAGVPDMLCLLNLLAWLAGLVAAAVLARLWPPLRRAWPLVCIGMLVLTLLSPGLEGVHRWVTVGPVRLNGAAIVVPAALVALAGEGGRQGVPRLLILFATFGLLAAQPDASQASAAAAGMMVASLLATRRWRERASDIAVPVALAIVAMAHPDPVEPVPHVEGIIDLARGISAALALLMVAALAGASLAPLAWVRTAPIAGRCGSPALAVYLVACALAPAVAAFPVPFAGIGLSPILGAWLGFGALAGETRRLGRNRV